MSGTGIATDPPIHDQFRRVIQRGFSPAKLAQLSRDIDRIADELARAVPPGSLARLLAEPARG